MAFRKKDIEAVTISAHLAGPATVYIEWFHVPRDLRRIGLGTVAYKKWEKDLPRVVRYVTLHAADAGVGPSGNFWLSLGFQYRWDFGFVPDPSSNAYEDSQAMIKGVHGAPTPKTARVDINEGS